MFVALELGFLYAIMAFGVYLTYRVLDFPDMTVDGSFTTGASVAAVMIVSGYPPLLGTFIGVLAGMFAGVVTGLLHTWGKINALLAGILTQIALYSINLRIMGRAQIPLLGQKTLFTGLREANLLGTWVSVSIFAGLATVVGVAIYWFLGTNMGVAMRATGDNETMSQSNGINTSLSKISGVAISNGAVAGCGALIAQYQGFSDISMGIGMVVAGLASVIVGQALFGMTAVWQATLAAGLGSLIYRGVIQLALANRMNPNDMKLISAILVVVAMVLPRWAPFKSWRLKRRHRKEQLAVALEEKGINA